MHNSFSKRFFIPFILTACSTNHELSKNTPTDSRAPSSVDPTFGRSRISYGREDCVTIAPIPGTEADAGGLKDEDKMCEIKFDDPKLALCPATYSTNPATEVHEIPPEMTRETFTATMCKKSQNKAGKKIAKFKQTTSCSHTSSILGYNKLGQALGVHVEIPVSVYRSMEISTHEPVKNMATRYAVDTISDTWKGLIRQIADRNPKVVKDDLLYGALLDGVSNESRHPNLNKRGSSNRAAPFMATPTWALATSKNPIRESISPKLEKLAAFIEVRDASEMVILDHIMAQQDRFGNIAARDVLYFVQTNEDGSQKIEHVKMSKALKPLNKDDPSKKTFLDDIKEKGIPYVAAKKMVLKDNDCGLRSSDNDVRKNDMVNKLRHLSPKVYVAVQKLASSDPAVMSEYLQKQLLMSRDEAKGVWQRLVEVAGILKKNCMDPNQKLYLDLEIDSFLGLAPANEVTCE